MRQVIALLVLSVAGAGAASAQSIEPRLEIGGQASVLRLSDFNATSVGLGGRVLFRVSEWISLDGEVGLFPNEKIVGRTAETSIGPFVSTARGSVSTRWSASTSARAATGLGRS
jgi:hypothetical protein